MSNDLNEQLSKVLSEFNLVAFKLKTLSESFDKLINKVDDLTTKISETKERQSLDGLAIQTLQTEAKDLEKKISLIDEQLVNVRISMAEKLAWGSLGGGLAAGIIKIIELGMGG